jgi:hypothetical protein
MKITGIQFDLKWEDKSPITSVCANCSRPQRRNAVHWWFCRRCLPLGSSMNAAAIDDTETGETRDFLAGRRANGNLPSGWTGEAQILPGDRPIEVSSSIRRGQRSRRYEKIFPFTPGGESANYSGW